jgi:two-component sensor histidine kinase
MHFPTPRGVSSGFFGVANPPNLTTSNALCSPLTGIAAHPGDYSLVNSLCCQPKRESMFSALSPEDPAGDEVVDGPLSHGPVEELLRLETHHRLMNTFAILCAILQRELNTPDPRSQAALARSVRIIGAHSALHRCLALGTPRGPVPLGEYVTKLSKCLSEAVLEPMNVTCEAIADEGFMPAAQAERLSLVLCELVVNAAKHGFPHKRTGMVRIEIARQDHGWCCIVADNGGGFPDAVPAAGLGSQIVEALVRRLNGRMIVQSTTEGTTVTLLIPLVPATLRSET